MRRLSLLCPHRQSRSLKVERRGVSNDSLDFRAKILVAYVAYKARWKHNVIVPERLRDDVLHADECTDFPRPAEKAIEMRGSLHSQYTNSIQLKTNRLFLS
jgi:hypothetical protein